MNIAVLSGKGGTGKTFVTVNLAVTAKQSVYVDCDVEEPNGHLFLKPENVKSEKVCVSIPVVNEDLCTGCRACVQSCNYNALAYIDKVLLFEDVCHSCGRCVYVCPANAIGEKDKEVGSINTGNSGDITTISGVLNIGSISGVPVVNKIQEMIKANEQEQVFIDCPPGSSCTVIESIKNADYCLLVAEPTLFGVHNMEMVHSLARLFKKPCGVVINKAIPDNTLVEDYCQNENLKILETIPLDSEIGKINSKGDILVLQNEKYCEVFSELLKNITKEVSHEKTINP